MKETLKMVRFDYSVVRDISSKYVLIFAVICAALSLAGIFPAAFGFLIFPLGLFSPMQAVRKGDFMKIYGLLPVKREYIIRALFSEIAVPQLIGGVICELLLFISGAVGENRVLPSFIQENIYDALKHSIGEYIGYSDLFTLAAAALAFITTVVLFFYMILEIKGETFAAACCIPFLLIIGFAAVMYTTLFFNGSVNLPALGDMLPASAAGRAGVIAASFASVVIAGFLLCELTVKKTAEKEI